MWLISNSSLQHKQYSLTTVVLRIINNAMLTTFSVTSNRTSNNDSKIIVITNIADINYGKIKNFFDSVVVQWSSSLASPSLLQPKELEIQELSHKINDKIWHLHYIYHYFHHFDMVIFKIYNSNNSFMLPSWKYNIIHNASVSHIHWLM